MNLQLRSIVQQNLDNGYEIQFDKAFDRTWGRLKVNMGPFIGFAFLCALFCLMGFGLFIGPILVMGFSTYSHAMTKEENPPFNAFFAPFGRFGSLFVLGLLFLLIGVLISLPTLMQTIPIYLDFFAHMQDPEAVNDLIKDLDKISGLSSFYSSAAQFIITVFTFYAPYLVMYGDYSVIEALGTSVQLVLKNIWLLLVLLLLASVIKIFGFFFCCVGAALSYPYAYILYHEIFNQVILSKHQEMDAFGEL